MTAPIVMGQKVLGVFDIQSPHADAFTPDDVTLVQALADTVAVGLRNAGLFATETRRRILAETLREVSAVLVSSLDMESVLDGLLVSLERVVDYEAALILLRRDEENNFIVRAVRGVVNEAEVLKQCLPAGDDLIERMWGLLRRMEMPDTAHVGHDRLYAPMQVGGKDIGILAVERVGPDQFSAEDIEIINTFGNQAALAIEGAQLFASQQEEAWVTTALLSVAESVNSTLELDQTLATLVRLTVMLVGVARCGILQWDSNLAHFVGGAAWGLAPDVEEDFSSLVLKDDPLVTALTKSTESITAGEGGAAPLPESLQHLFGVSTLMALPLVAKGTLVGAMLVDRPGLGEPIDQRRRMNILSGIAHQSALALETARLQAEATERQRLERELDVAQRIQRSFLPEHLPKLSGWELAAFYRAAHQVGGDFYDFIPLRGNKWGIVIADVADKGVPAALFMALCRTNIRASAFSRDDPVETIVRVNQLLISDSRSDLFVTVWYGVWDPATGEIVYASAGHNPPLIIQSDGLCCELTAHGIALGVIEPIQLERKRVVLDPDDVMVAYTDGITDALRSDEAEFGLVGLQSTVAAAHHRSASDIVARVVKAVDTFTGDEPQFDDLTLIVLKRVASGDARSTTELQMVKRPLPDTPADSGNENPDEDVSLSE
jgi:serine phosphatase RsbU (regulator of sigma subunit)